MFTLALHLRSKTPMRQLFFLLLLSVFIGSCSREKAAEAGNKIPYLYDSTNVCDVYPFPGDTCFVLIHGGAWEGGDKSNFYRSAEIFEKYHRAACNMNYTVNKKYCGDLNQTEVKNCLDFLSSRFQYKKFVLAGLSAGSTIAMDYAYHTADPRVVGVLCIGTIGDLTKNANSKVLFNAGYAYKDVVASSPINATTFCKTLFVHGNTDDIAFPVQSVDMNNKLTASGCPSMLLLKDRGHWFDEEILRELFTFSVYYFQ